MWESLKARVLALPHDLKDKIEQMFQRIVDVETTTATQDPTTKEYRTILKQGHIVHVKFVGMGTAINNKHYAIVWDAEPKRDHVIVIPMTSQPYPPLDLGPIKGLNMPVNVVKISHIQTVSRKSLTLKISHSKTVELETDQLKKVREWMRVQLHDDPSLFDVLNNKVGALLPVAVPDDVRLLLKRSVTYKLETNSSGITILHFMTLEDTAYYSLMMEQLPGINFAVRKQILRELLSNDAAVRAAAEQRISTAVAVAVASPAPAATGLEP